ncbi:MAG: SH3 domain-containing protein [Candidatus Acidiferrales bacterium]
MKARILLFCLFAAGATSARADSVSYAQCGTYDAYLLIYKTTQRFEELGKLRCGEQVEVLNRSGAYDQIRTIDGRLGWVRDSDLSATAPPPQRVYTFGLSETPKPSEPAPAPKPPVYGLTNEDVLAMHRRHPGSELIVKKIRSSHCEFDTSLEAIQRLKAAGVSDKVILAMMETPVVSAESERRAPESVDVNVPDGTAIEVELKGNISAEEVQEGAIVEMSAAEDLVVNGVPIVQRGSAARARILAVRQPGAHGGGGEIAWFMQDIVATTGDRLPVTFAAKQAGNLKTKNFEGYPFFLSDYHKGGTAIKADDRRFRVVIHGDTVLTVSQSLTAALPARSKPKAQVVRQVSVEPAASAETAPPPQATPEEAKP